MEIKKINIKEIIKKIINKIEKITILEKIRIILKKINALLIIIYLPTLLTLIYLLCFLFGMDWFDASNNLEVGICTLIVFIIGSTIPILVYKNPDKAEIKSLVYTTIWYCVCIGAIPIISLYRVIDFNPSELIKIEYVGYEKDINSSYYNTNIEFKVYNLNENKTRFNEEYNDFSCRELYGILSFYYEGELIYQDEIEIDRFPDLNGYQTFDITITENKAELYKYDIDDLKITFKLTSIFYINNEFDYKYNEMVIYKGGVA